MAANTDETLNLNALLEHSEKNLQRLRQKITALRCDEETPPRLRRAIETKPLVKVLEKVSGCAEVNASKIDNFINDRTNRLEPPCYQAIVRHIWDLGGWANDAEKQGAAQGEDALFHAFAGFLGVQAQTLRNLTSEIPGSYRVWRASMHVPGSYVQGMMEITSKANTGALWAVETHAFQGEDEVGGASEAFEGYIVKKSRYYVILARQRQGHRGPPRVTVIHNTLSDGTHITAMYGIVTGCYGSNALFAAPIYIERVAAGEEDNLKDGLKIVSANEIPASIRAKLRVRVDEGVIRF